MVARARAEPRGLVVRFDRNGHPPETRHASDPQQALLQAIALMAEKRHLLAGDRLSVVAGDVNEDEVVL